MGSAILVSIIIAGSAIYLVRRWYFMWSGRGGACGGCGGECEKH